MRNQISIKIDGVEHKRTFAGQVENPCAVCSIRRLCDNDEEDNWADICDALDSIDGNNHFERVGLQDLEIPPSLMPRTIEEKRNECDHIYGVVNSPDGKVKDLIRSSKVYEYKGTPNLNKYLFIYCPICGEKLDVKILQNCLRKNRTFLCGLR